MNSSDIEALPVEPPDFEVDVSYQRCSWWRSINWVEKINKHRLGVQWFTGLSVSTVFLFIPAVHRFFDGLEIFIPISAVGLFDPTIGGHVRKLLDRLSGVLGALFAAALVLLPLGLSGFGSVREFAWLRWVMYAQAVLIAFFWGYWREVYPRHPTLQFVGITSSISIYIMTSDRFLNSMWRVTLANLIGACIGAVVFRFVLPRRARILIRADLVQALNKLAATLQPLVELEAGLVKSPSFFRRQLPKSGSYLARMLTGTISKLGSFNGSTRQGSVRHGNSGHANSSTGVRHGNSSIRHNDSSLKHGDSITVPYDEFRDFRDEIWTRIEGVQTLLMAQDQLLRPAEREYSRRVPHKFPTDAYKEFLRRVRRLHYHTVSLLLVLDTQDAIATTAFPPQMLGAWAGAVRISPGDEIIRQHFATTQEERLSVAADFSVEDEDPTLATVPLLKWASVYSPYISAASKHAAACIAKMALSLQHLKMTDGIYRNLEAAEHSMHLLSEERKRWQSLVEKLYTMLLSGGGLEEQEVSEVERVVLRRLMGVRLEEYSKLDMAHKKRLWNSFGSCVDRLSVTSRTLLALVVELAACVTALANLCEHFAK